MLISRITTTSATLNGRQIDYGHVSQRILDAPRFCLGIYFVYVCVGVCRQDMCVWVYVHRTCVCGCVSPRPVCVCVGVCLLDMCVWVCVDKTCVCGCVSPRHECHLDMSVCVCVT